MTSARLILVTAADREEAARIADALVAERLAACVNVVPGLRSIYRWQEAVEEADEVLLLIKTQQQMVEALQKRVHDLHSYDVPEFLVINVESGSAGYLAWIAANVQ